MSFDVMFDSRYPGLTRDRTRVKLSAFFTCLCASVVLLVLAVYYVFWRQGHVITRLDRLFGYFLYFLSVVLFLFSPIIALCKGYNRGLTGTLLFRFVREDDTGRWTYRLESTKKASRSRRQEKCSRWTANAATTYRLPSCIPPVGGST